MADHIKLHQLQRRVQASTRQLTSHLLSIACDNTIVCEVRDFLSGSGLSMIANIRNGLWYDASFDGTCYFKSTDGHVRNWSFSSGRLNIETACRAFKEKGIVIVDSTKAGKRYPDSMTYTMPIWCSVVNCLLYRSISGEIEIDLAIVEHFTSLAPWIPSSYQQQLHRKVLQIITNLPQGICDIIVHQVLPSYRQHFTHESTDLNDFCALRIVWISPNEDGCIDWQGQHAEGLIDHIANQSTGLGYVPIIALSCSGVRNSTTTLSTLSPLGMSHSSVHSWTYIAGAGDDDEFWSEGLTPDVFWRNREYILANNRDEDVENRVHEILLREKVESEIRNANKSGGADGNISDSVAVSSALHLTVLPDEEWQLLSEMESESSRFVCVNVCEGKTRDDGKGAKGDDADGKDGEVLTLHIHPFKKDRSHYHSEWTETLLPSLLPFLAGTRPTYICIRASDGAMGKEVGGLLLLSALLQYYTVDTGEARFVFNEESDENREKEGETASMTKEDVRVYMSVLQTILPWFYPQRRLVKLVMAHFLPIHQL